jgi:hypothetical protein
MTSYRTISRVFALVVCTAAAVAYATTPKAPSLNDGPDREGRIEISWNPGHYVAYGLTTDQPGGVAGHTPQHLQILNSFLRSPWCSATGSSTIEGVLIKIHWRNIQFDRFGDPPNYKIIDDWYEAVKSRCGAEKRLVVMFKIEAENQFYGPAYDPKLHAGMTSGEVNANIGRRACAPQEVWDRGDVVEDSTVGSSGHCAAAIWRDSVMDPLKRTLTALGRYLNNKPLVEGIFFEGEGSKGWVNRTSNPLGFNQTALVAAYRDALLTLRAAAPNKIVGVGTNYFDPRAGWEQQILATCQNMMGCAFIWPDTFSTERNFPHTDAHRYYCDNSGIVGLFGGQEAPLKNRWIPVSSTYGGDAIEGALDHCCYNPNKAVD